MALGAIKVGFMTATLGKEQSLTGMADNGRFGLAGRGCEKHGVLNNAVALGLLLCQTGAEVKGRAIAQNQGFPCLSDLWLVLYIYIRR